MLVTFRKRERFLISIPGSRGSCYAATSGGHFNLNEVYFNARVGICYVIIKLFPLGSSLDVAPIEYRNYHNPVVHALIRKESL
jgi:hypothetical protein